MTLLAPSCGWRMNGQLRQPPFGLSMGLPFPLSGVGFGVPGPGFGFGLGIAFPSDHCVEFRRTGEVFYQTRIRVRLSDKASLPAACAFAVIQPHF